VAVAPDVAVTSQEPTLAKVSNLPLRTQPAESVPTEYAMLPPPLEDAASMSEDSSMTVKLVSGFHVMTGTASETVNVPSREPEA
jgi:hypothetical protein